MSLQSQVSFFIVFLIMMHTAGARFVPWMAHGLLCRLIDVSSHLRGALCSLNGKWPASLFASLRRIVSRRATYNASYLTLYGVSFDSGAHHKSGSCPQYHITPSLQFARCCCTSQIVLCPLLGLLYHLIDDDVYVYNV